MAYVPGSPAVFGPGGFGGVVMGCARDLMGADARTIDFLEQPKAGPLKLPVVKAPLTKQAQMLKRANVPTVAVNVVDSLIAKTNQKKVEDEKKRADVAKTATATANLNTQYTIERKKADKAALEFNNYLATTPIGKAGIDWGTLPAALGVVAGMASGGLGLAAGGAIGGAAAGLGAGLQYSGNEAKKLTLGNLVDDASGVINVDEGLAVAHEVVEASELGQLAREGEQIIRQGVDVTNQVLNTANQISGVIDATLTAAAAGDPAAANSVAKLGLAVIERGNGVSRERVPERKGSIEGTSYLSAFDLGDLAAIGELERPEWAVMADGAVRRLFYAEAAPKAARWIVRAGKVERP